jgi:hypothetical protein
MGRTLRLLPLVLVPLIFGACADKAEQSAAPSQKDDKDRKEAPAAEMRGGADAPGDAKPTSPPSDDLAPAPQASAHAYTPMPSEPGEQGDPSRGVA